MPEELPSEEVSEETPPEPTATEDAPEETLSEDAPPTEGAFGGYNTLEELVAAKDQADASLDAAYDAFDSPSDEELEDAPPPPQLTPEQEAAQNRAFLLDFQKDPKAMIAEIINDTVDTKVTPQLQHEKLAREVSVAQSQSGPGQAYEGFGELVPTMTKLAKQYKALADGPDGLRLTYELARARSGKGTRKQNGPRKVGKVDQPETPGKGNIPPVGFGKGDKAPTPAEERAQYMADRRKNEDIKLGLKPEVKGG